MTLADLIKDFLDSSRERIKTPITGSFLIAFVLYNWRPIMLLMFSDTSIESRIYEITQLYCNAGAIFWPTVIAICYVGLIPYIMWGFDEATTEALKKRVENKYLREIHDLKQYEGVLFQQKENEEARSKNRPKELLNDEIKSLNQQIETMKKQHQSALDNYESLLSGKNNLSSIGTKYNDTIRIRRHEFDPIVQKPTEKTINFYKAFERKYQLMFLEYAERILKGDESILFKESFKFIDLGLMETDGEAKLHLTSEGEKLYDYINFNNNLP